MTIGPHRSWRESGRTAGSPAASTSSTPTTTGISAPTGTSSCPKATPPVTSTCKGTTGVFDVHGGITYGGDGRRVIGWDTAHYGDNWEGDPTKPGRLWTVDDVEDETIRLADQVADFYTSESVALFKASRTLRELADELDPTKETRA